MRRWSLRGLIAGTYGCVAGANKAMSREYTVVVAVVGSTVEGHFNSVLVFCRLEQSINFTVSI